MEVKYRLEKLNEVQFAYDENRRKELEAKGFKVVKDTAVIEQIPVEADSTVKKSGNGRKAARKSKEAGGEEEDA